MGNCPRQSDPPKIRRGRVAAIFGAGLVHLVFIILGAWAILDRPTLDKFFPCESIIAGSFSLLGVVAFGSAAAFFTACLNAMQRVLYRDYKPWWRRALKCVDSASQVETLFRIFIGISVSGGAYLLARLTGS